MKDLLKTIGILFTIIAILWSLSSVIPKVIDIYKNKPKIEIKIDTTTKERIDTIWIREPKSVGEVHWRKVVDTFYTKEYDTIVAEVPLSLKKYEGDTLTKDGVKVEYRANVSGYRASLDSLWFAVQRKDSIITKEITKYKWKKGFRIAPYAGYGYNPIDKRLEPSIGVALVYNF